MLRKTPFLKNIGIPQHHTVHVFHPIINTKHNSQYCSHRNQQRSHSNQATRSHRKRQKGYSMRGYRSHRVEITGYKAHCTKAKGNRKIQVNWAFEAARAASRERITSEKGILLRINRTIQSEGAFGVLKEDRHFRRLRRKGLQGDSRKSCCTRLHSI